MRFAIGIQYLGCCYHGWQKQKGLNSIQERIEFAFSKVANQKIDIIGSGRTDKGVHACGQVAHFETKKIRSDYNWLNGANRYLPDDINISWVKQVDENFHARFSAVKRVYRYIIYNDRVHSSFWHRFTMLVHQPMNEEKMHVAAQKLIGIKDFSAVRGADCQSKTPVREVYYCNVRRVLNFIIIDIAANAFLHQMVRNIVGLLVPIGLGKRDEFWLEEVLNSRDRKNAGMTAQPNGLYLYNIEFNDIYSFEKNLQYHLVHLFDRL